LRHISWIIRRHTAPDSTLFNSRQRRLTEAIHAPKPAAQNHGQIAKSERLKSDYWDMTLTPPWAGDESARSQAQHLLDEKSVA